jgi:hypothetical protein
VTDGCGDGDGEVPPIPGAEHAPRNTSTASPAADFPTRLRSTGDNLT